MRLALALLAGSLAAADLPAPVATLLTQHCASCHSGANPASAFSIASYDTLLAGGKKHHPAIVPGDPDGSPLLALLRGDASPRMPIGAPPLAAAQIQLLESWIASLPKQPALARSSYRWPFERPAKPVPPTVRHDARNPIDQFILARLEAQNLTPAPEASRATLARRLYLDLVGLPPTPAELRTFLADARPDAYERLVDQLLADPRYGERWARHWLDLVRYGETSGLEGDGAIGNAWRYRDWVIDAFNSDLPYRQFVLQQLGGADEHSQTRNNYEPNVQGHIPLGYYRVAPWDRSNLVADEVRQNYLSEITTATGSIFLGLTIGCARCHDHKYDPIPQRDFYRFQAFFNAIQVEDRDVPFRDPELASRSKAEVEKYQQLLRDGPEKKALDALKQSALPRLVAYRKQNPPAKLSAEDLRLELKRPDRRIFSAAEARRYADLKEDADRTLDPEEKDLLNRYETELLRKLETAYAAPGFDSLARFDSLTTDDAGAELNRATSKIFPAVDRDRYQELQNTLTTYRRRLERWQPHALTIRNVPGPPTGPALPPTRILLRGDYRLPGDPVEAGFPSALSGGRTEPATIESDRYRQFPTRGYRLTLAKWIASPDNPLTARVFVNRVWQHHFGRGIVPTPSDFGINGDRPTHPELLDWLAHYFIENNWSTKQLHRLMLTSATYRQSANHPQPVVTADPENQLLSRFPRRRLSAEEIRDSILAVSGRLHPERGGPPVFPALPDDLADFARYGRGGDLMWETNAKPEDARRRSIYTFQRRSMPLPMMASFDAPVFSESCERRSQTTTPLQALNLMNGDLVRDEAAALAARLRTPAEAFEHVLLRAPRPDELARTQSLSLIQLCRVLFNSNEFLYID